MQYPLNCLRNQFNVVCDSQTAMFSCSSCFLLFQLLLYHMNFIIFSRNTVVLIVQVISNFALICEVSAYSILSMALFLGDTYTDKFCLSTPGFITYHIRFNR